MRKFLSAGILTGFLFLPSKSHAIPLDVPTGGNAVSPPFTASSPGYFDFASTFSVTLTTPPAGYQYCLDKMSITAPSAGLFSIYWATSTLNGLPQTTTGYAVWLAAATPYNQELDYREPLCSPPNNLMFMNMGVTGSTMSIEGYTFKGWNP